MYRVIIFLLLRLILPSLIFTSVVMLPYAVAYADDNDDDDNNEDGKHWSKIWEKKSKKSHQQSIRKAVQQKQILPLSEIKQIVEIQTESEIIGIELERKNRGWVYEFKTVDSRGRLRKIYVDATNGSILRHKD